MHGLAEVEFAPMNMSDSIVNTGPGRSSRCMSPLLHSKEKASFAFSVSVETVTACRSWSTGSGPQVVGAG